MQEHIGDHQGLIRILVIVLIIIVMVIPPALIASKVTLANSTVDLSINKKEIAIK